MQSGPSRKNILLVGNGPCLPALSISWLLSFSVLMGTLPPSHCDTKGHSVSNLQLSFPNCLIRDFYLIISRIQPDILECEVKWALESITTNKASGANGIPVEPFQIPKDDAVKVLHSICQQIWKTQQWPQDWKRSMFTLIPKKSNAKTILKLLYNCAHFTC